MISIIHSFKHTSAFILGFIILSYIVQIILVNRIDSAVSGVGNASILVIAHPDDETMFFGPTILNLIEKKHHLLILCLSSSPSQQLLVTRRKELTSVAESFGNFVNVAFADDPSLTDDMNEDWKSSTILGHIEKQLQYHKSLNIQTLITFDSYGVSGHSNHKAIFKTIDSIKRNQDLKVLLLESVSLVRKYTFFLDSIPTVIVDYFLNEKPSLTFALNVSNYFRLKEKLELHKSQMVWFRQLYKAFSRYMFINNLVEYL